MRAPAINARAAYDAGCLEANPSLNTLGDAALAAAVSSSTIMTELPEPEMPGFIPLQAASAQASSSLPPRTNPDQLSMTSMNQHVISNNENDVQHVPPHVLDERECYEA